MQLAHLKFQHTSVDARLSPNQPFLPVIRGKSSSGILQQAKPASKSEQAGNSVEKPHDGEGLCESLY